MFKPCLIQAEPMLEGNIQPKLYYTALSATIKKLLLVSTGVCASFMGFRLRILRPFEW